MVAETEIRITGEPLPIPSMCRFVVDRPLYENQSFFFGNVEQASESPLARRLFAIDGIQSVLISHNSVTITKVGPDPWPEIGRQIGTAIREHLATGEPAVSEELRGRLPSEEELRIRVADVLQREVLPAVASHGGTIQLVDVKDNTVYLQLGGGCHGCGMASVTLKQGVEVAIRNAVPEVGDIIDVTDHASGQNPYYAP